MSTVMAAFCLLIVPLASFAQAWPIVLAAVGSDRQTSEMSRTVLDRVEKRLVSEYGVSVAGEKIYGLRIEIRDDKVLERARQLGSRGAAVLQFVPHREAKGFVHLGVAATTDNRFEYFAEYLDISEIQSWQERKLGALIRRTISGRKEVVVELHVYTRPARSFFTVGGSKPDMTDEPGRYKNEGFKLWYGLRPVGQTVVDFYKDVEFEPARRTIDVVDKEGHHQDYLDVALKRRGK